MQLPGALFDQIAVTLIKDADAPSRASEPSDPGPARRRRESRVDVDAKVTVIPLTAGLGAAPFDVPVRDLSPGGIGFLHPERVGLDQQFVVLLPEGRGLVAVLCQVAYYQPLSDGAYAIGAEFVRVLRRPAATDAATLPLNPPAVPARRVAS
jgi:hypothetical protein